jgi:RHS repeat-associated protein
MRVSHPNSCDAVNGGANSTPQTAHPIDITTGAKLFRAQDFVSADGSLDVMRFYNSRSFSGSYNEMAGLPAGLGVNWRLSFQHELHLNYSTGQRVQFIAADGATYAFNKNSSGGMDADVPDYGLRYQTDYRVELVGTWPTNNADILNSSSQWKVYDEDDAVWTFQTIQDPVTGKYLAGRPTGVVFRNGLQWTFSYGTNHELTSLQDSYGKTLTFTWRLRDMAGIGGVGIYPAAVDTVTLPDTSKIKYLYDNAEGLTAAYDNSDRLLAVEHRDASNNLLDKTTYLYENTDWLWHVTGIEDVNGTRRWTVTYDADGRATASKGPSDIDKTAVSYGTVAWPSFTRTVTNALGKSAVYTFHWDYNDTHLESINGTASTHCPASAKSYSYSSRMIASTTDEEGRVTSYTRNSIGRPTQIVDGDGTASARTTSITWHSTLRVPTQIVRPGFTADFTWTSGQLTQVTQTDTTTTTTPYSTNGQTRTWKYTYDSYGHLLTVDGPLSGTGDTVTYTYDISGYLATITNEVGHVLTVSAVNGRGQPTTVVDENSVTWTLTYDSEGRVKTIAVDPSGLNATTSIDYSPVGDIAKITRPNGVYLQYTYNDGRQITKIEDNTGAYLEFDLDLMDGITGRRIKDPSNNLRLSQTATFDELGRFLTFVGAASQTWTHSYDKTNNLVSVTDPRSHVFQQAFDSVNRLISQTDENSAVVTLTRNGSDDVTNYADPRSLSTAYVRSGFGEAIQRSSPDTGTTVYEYNALGKVTKITDARSVITNLTYDNAGRLLTKTFPASTGENITLTWDATASGNKGIGQLTKIQDASGSVEWTYNTLGHAIQEKKTTASIVYTVDYQYDLDGNVTQVTYPSGRMVMFSRDSTGRISAVTTKKDSGSSTVTLASGVAYEPFGPLKSLTHGNSLVLTKTFSQDYRISTILTQDSATSTTVLNRSYAFGDGINVTGITDNLTSARSETYGYTNANRLNSAGGIWGSLAWTYDGVGNRTSEALTSGSTTTSSYAYPGTSNRLSTVTQGSNVRTFTHDSAGNVTADDRIGTTYNYRYNNRGRLDRLTIGSTVTADYTYDGLERLAIRATQNMTPAGTTHYVYDLSGHLIAESTDTGQTVREYVWLDDMPLAVVADVDTLSPNLYFVHTDHLDRPLRLTDGSQAVVWDAVYRPFGEVVSISGSASNNVRFPGQYFLIESGLHYNWYRHYDPTIGRYLQTDPLGFVDGPDIYAYANSAPGMYVDPTGQFVPVMIAIGAAIAYVMTPTVANAPGPNDETIAVDDIAPFKNAGEVAACYVGRMALYGHEIQFSKNFRIAPFGNRTGDRYGKWPHYHRRGDVDPATGKTQEGQGVGRHRPWEIKSPDKSWRDRF